MPLNSKYYLMAIAIVNAFQVKLNCCNDRLTFSWLTVVSVVYSRKCRSVSYVLVNVS